MAKRKPLTRDLGQAPAAATVLDQLSIGKSFVLQGGRISDEERQRMLESSASNARLVELMRPEREKMLRPHWPEAELTKVLAFIERSRDFAEYVGKQLAPYFAADDELHTKIRDDLATERKKPTRERRVRPDDRQAAYGRFLTYYYLARKSGCSGAEAGAMAAKFWGLRLNSEQAVKNYLRKARTYCTQDQIARYVGLIAYVDWPKGNRSRKADD